MILYLVKINGVNWSQSIYTTIFSIMNKLNKKIFIALALIAVFSLSSISTLSAQTVWLDQLDLSAATQGWGIPKKNRTVDGNIMTIAGKTFERGFGTHAESSLFIQLDGKANSFTAQVGIDDEVKGRQPAVEFIVYGDGAKLWSSGVMHEGDTARRCNVKLSGVKKLELRVTDEERDNNHADWADAKFEAVGVASFATYYPVPSEPYILTPKPSAKPKINSASVFGVRPGSPFQFRIPATGDRPMTFMVTGLPQGLKLDQKTGLITGKLVKAGTYVIQLKAKNAKGIAEKSLRIICGDKIALTPPMGWNSWNCFAHEVSGEKVKRAAEVMVKTGLINYGWNYVNIDDYWQNNRDSKDPSLQGKLRDEAGNIVPNKKFGDMKALTDYVHGLGLKIGIYSSPGPWTCDGGAGSYGYERQDAETLCQMGFRLSEIRLVQLWRSAKWNT